MFSYGNKKALLLGNSYKNTNYKFLPSENDVKTVDKLLREKLDFKNIIIKYDIYPEKEIKKFLMQGKEGDLFFIYFSGHGGELVGSVKLPNTGLLSSWINPDGSYFLSYELDKLLSQINFKCKIIIFSDSCYSGKFLNHYDGLNPIYYIGASEFSKTGNYIVNGVKSGALVLLFEFLLKNNKDIIFENILNDTEEFRRKNRFLKFLTLKKSFNISD